MRPGAGFVCLLCCGVIVGAAGGADLPTVTPDATVERDQIPEVYTWDLSPLAASDAAWDEEAKIAAGQLDELATRRGGIGAVDGLVQYLELWDAATRRINRLTLYANLSRDTATTDPDRVARHQRALALTGRLMDSEPVLREALLSLDASELREAYTSNHKLVEFRPYIDSLRRRADRILGSEAERVLSLAGDNLWASIDLNELPSASENAFAALLAELPLPTINNRDGDEVQLTLSNYGLYRSDDDRDVRRQAVDGVLGALRGFENTLAATLIGQAEFDVFLARSRGYDTALEAYLNKDDLDPAVYHNLIAAVRDHAPALHRYMELRRRVMGLDEVRLFDLYVPLAEPQAMEIPFPEARTMIVEALRPLGEDYIARLTEAIDPSSGWMDLYPHLGKQSGAFSAATYGVHPYIKMNYQNQFDDVSTLAHELGHALHSDLAMNAQPHLSWRYVPFVAEIASTCNEVLLSQYLAENAESTAAKAWLLSELAETIRTTIYRQTLFAEFELKVHQMVEAEQPVTATDLNALYASLIRDYYGPAYVIGDDDPLEWAYIPHFYWKYYVYTYANRPFVGDRSRRAAAER